MKRSPPGATRWPTLFDDDGIDPALLADLLTPPGEVELAEREHEVDPARDSRAAPAIAATHSPTALGSDALQRRYRALHRRRPLRLDAAGKAQRRLKRRVLELLALVDAACRRQTLAHAQYQAADGMTDRLAALAVLVRSGARAGRRGAGGFPPAPRRQSAGAGQVVFGAGAGAWRSGTGNGCRRWQRIRPSP